jgi:hypothetical protein
MSASLKRGRRPLHFMKRIFALFAIASLSLGALRTEAQDVSIETFYNQLDPYGDWVDAGDYGYVWHPRDIDDTWRPYADGHWAYTDAGWTWLSDEPYSWAVYHYGRWFRIEDVGWVWAPGTEWAPAWVSFRYGHRHVGWAPLPPEANFSGDFREIGAWSDSYYDVGPTDYVFVDVRNFGAPGLREFELPANGNLAFISETTNITNVRVENNTVFLGGPDFNAVNRDSAQKIPRLQLERRTEGFGSDPNSFRATVQGNSLRVAAPVIAAGAATLAPPKVARKLPSVQVNHGWKGAGDPAAVKKMQAKVKSEAKLPAGLPPQPKFQRTAVAPGGAAIPAGKAANVPARSAGTPAAVPGKKTAPNEKTAATEKPLPTAAATPARKDQRGKRDKATPAVHTETEPAKPKNERPAPAAAGVPAAPSTSPELRKPEPPAKPEERAPKPKPERQTKPEEHAPKPEGQVKPEERAPKSERQVKPEERAPKPEAAKARPEAPAPGKKKDEKKDEKKPE